MPKAKKRKKAAGRVASNRVVVQVQEGTTQTAATSVTNRSGFFSAVSKNQSILFASMVALGFWGCAIFCVFFYTEDANHYIYGALMALTAVGWSISALRRWSSAQRQSA